jgi:hypothetical protein
MTERFLQNYALKFAKGIDYQLGNRKSCINSWLNIDILRNDWEKSTHFDYEFGYVRR